MTAYRNMYIIAHFTIVIHRRTGVDNATFSNPYSRIDYSTSHDYSSFAYHYIFHGSNIVRDESLSNRVDYWLSARERYEALAPKYPELEGALALDVMRVNAICWSLAWGARGNDKAVFEQVRADMVVFARKHCRSAREASKYGRLGCMRLWLTQSNCAGALFLSSVLARWIDGRHST